MLVENLLSMETRANGSAQAISAFGPRYTSPYSTYNRTDVQSWSISPILQHRFSSFADLRMQYTRDSVSTDGQAQAAAFGNSQSDTGLVSLASVPSGRNLGWSAQYSRQNLDTERFGASQSENASATLRYRLSRSWTVTGSGGYDSYEYDHLGGRTAGRSVSAGFVWTPSSRTSIEARLGHSYLGKTGSLQAVQRSRNLVSRVSYTDQVTTSRSQFVLPSAIDTAAMLDQLFSSMIPDPAARAEAVQAYLAATGLPPTLANSVNYLSNRYMRDRRLQAAYIYNMPRSSLSLSVYKSERTALSLQQSDSELLGSQLASLNDSVRQRGADLIFNYRLSARTSANAGLSSSNVTSISTGVATPAHRIELGLTHQFDRKTRGMLEVRHINNGSGALTAIAGGAAGGRGYTENAISATLSVKL
jgi:uncharacterized protein (PEP-CTERM system associated)